MPKLIVNITLEVEIEIYVSQFKLKNKIKLLI
jgi:hypothetical protein